MMNEYMDGRSDGWKDERMNGRMSLVAGWLAKINDPRKGVHPQSVIWAYDGPNSIRVGRYFVRVDPGIIF